MGQNSAQRPTHSDVWPILWPRYSGARGPLAEPTHGLRGLSAGTACGTRARTEAVTTLRARVAAWPTVALPWLRWGNRASTVEGHPPDKCMMTAAHPSFLPTGRGRKTRVVLGEKGSKGGVLGAPLTVEWVTTVEEVEVLAIGWLLAVSSCTSGEKVVRGHRHERRERRTAAYRGGVAAASDRPGRNGHTFKDPGHSIRSARGTLGG
jgi:hypothetical protein